MSTLRAIREIVVRHTSEGAEKVRRELDAQSAANEKLAKSSDGVARSTETTSRRQTSAQGAYDRLRSRIDQTYRAQLQLERGQRDLERAERQGIITAQEHARVLEQLRARTVGAATANDQLTRSARQSEGAFSRLSALAARISPMTAALGVGGLVGGGGAVMMLTESSRRMEEAERAGRRLQGVLEATGQAAGLSAREIQTFADGIEAGTGRAAEEVMAVAAQLSTFTSIGREEFQRTIVVANDLSEVFGGSLQSSLDAIARALDDPIKGFANLRQRGFALEEQELKLVEAFMAVGDQARAQDVILRNLEGQVGGAAVRAYDGLTKAQGDATKATEDAIDAFNRASGAADARIASTKAYADTMRFVADNMDTILPVAGALTALVGSRLATSFVTSTVAANAFNATLATITTRAGAASAAMALLGGPVGIGITTVTAIATGLLMWSRNGEEANRTMEEHERIVGEIRDRYAEADAARRQMTRSELEVDHSAAQSAVDERAAILDAAVQRFERAVSGLDFLEGYDDQHARQLLDIAAGYDGAAGSADAFVTSLRTLARTDPGFAEYIAQIDGGIDAFAALASEVTNAENSVANASAALMDVTGHINRTTSAVAGGTDALAAYKSAWDAIGQRIPEVAKQMKAEADLVSLNEEIATAQGRINQMIMSPHARGEEFKRLEEWGARARDEITGLATARRQLDEYENGARVGAMDARAQAVAREAGVYEKLRKELEAAGADTAELERAQAAHTQTLATVNARFDEQDAAARRASTGMKEAEKAARELEAANRALAGEADAAIRTFFPWYAAEQDAERLLAAINDTTNGLDDMQRAALRLQIAKNFEDALPKVDEFRKRGVKSAEDVGQALANNIGSTLLDIFDPSSTDSFFDRVLKGFADIGRQFAEIGKKNTLELLFGKDAAYTAANDNRRSVSPPGFPAGYELPFGGSREMRALNDNLDRSARSALAVARQFDGLNERADSKVLDGFMQASGNWNNLSAADTAWCAAFANAAIARTGGQGTGSNLASSFMGWGSGTNAPQVGDIVVLKPQAQGTSGHVGFVAGFGDGTVQVFGGNQSHGANTKSFGLDQVRGYRTGPGLREAVRDGSLDAQRAIAQGSVPGVGPQAGATGGQTVQGGIFGPQGQAMLGVGGAAFGAFAGGMQSGSPLGGLMGGAMSGFGAAGSIATAFPALGAMATPIGLIGGAALGLLGGLFGRSKRKREERRQREEQERQQRMQAQQQLDAQMPAILELQDTLLDRASGTLEKERARISAQLKQYQQLAKTAKNKAEIQRLNEMQDALSDYMERLFDQVRLTKDAIVTSMMAGRGLEPEFAKAAAEVRESSLAIRNYIADLTAAVGEGSPDIAIAQTAGREQLLRQISGPEELTEIYKALDTMHGMAAALGDELQKLGMSAEDAARAIADHLTRGIDKLRDDFAQGIRGEIADAQGLGYLNQIRSLIERRDEMRADARSLGVDPALIERWFQVQVQNVVDGTGLVGDALDPLIDLFPQLAGVLEESMATIENALSRAESDLRSAYNKQKGELEQSVSRLESFSAALAKYRDDIRLDRNLSPLAPFAKLTEAQEKFRQTAAKAAAGDEEAQGQLIDLSRSYLDEAKSYYASSEHYFSIFDEVSGILARTEASAKEEIDAAKLQLDLLDIQVGALIDINDSVLSVADAIDAFNAAQAARDTAQAKALEDYVRALNPEAAIPSYQPPGVAVNPADGGAGDAATGPKALTWKKIGNDETGAWRSSEGQYWSPRVERASDQNGWQTTILGPRTPYEAGLNFANQLPQEGQGGRWINGKWIKDRFLGGMQTGGIVGNGEWNRDSVLARYAGGGNIALAGGEGILTAPAMQMPGVRAFMEAANARRLPDLRMPVVRATGGGGEAALVAEVRALRDEVRTLRQAVGMGAQETVAAVERGNAVAREGVSASKRRNAA
ncbi:TIGR02594 family protein [Aureimonas mangrovi]|uniref:TIGR02594 family protein n=1 Tax=Aureimonas mangrovi TaxID=2758041 RepID=UPI00163D51D0|nr:TIGR02594 family protein [Aureimonas mangrovi]